MNLAASSFVNKLCRQVAQVIYGGPWRTASGQIGIFGVKTITKKYSNGEVTVVWKPDLCIHSTCCWKGLPEVFDPQTRPWVKIDGAGTPQIIAQVEKCPSKALSYFLNKDSSP